MAGIAKITQSEIDTYGVASAPTVLNGTAEENKAIFDRLAKMVLAPKINALIEKNTEYIDQRGVKWDGFYLGNYVADGNTNGLLIKYYDETNGQYKLAVCGCTYSCEKPKIGQTIKTLLFNKELCPLRKPLPFDQTTVLSCKSQNNIGELKITLYPQTNYDDTDEMLFALELFINGQKEEIIYVTEDGKIDDINYGAGWQSLMPEYSLLNGYEITYFDSSMFNDNAISIDKEINVSYEWNDIVTKNDLDVSLPQNIIATTNSLGSVIVGDRLSIDENGVLSADKQSYTLPAATEYEIGGVMAGDGLEVDEDGVLSIECGLLNKWTDASPKTVGKVKIGEDDKLYICKDFSAEVEPSEPELDMAYMNLYFYPEPTRENFIRDIAPSSGEWGYLKNQDGTNYIADPDYGLPSTAAPILAGSSRRTNEDGKVIRLILCKCSHFYWEDYDYSIDIVREETSATENGNMVDYFHVKTVCRETVGNMHKTVDWFVDSNELLFTEWGQLELYDLPAGILSTTPFYNYVWEEINSASASTPDFVYKCTGTDDDTAISSLISAISESNDSFYLKVVGTYGGGHLSIPQTNNNIRQIITIDFAGCDGLANKTLTISGTQAYATYTIVGFRGYGITHTGMGVVNLFNCYTPLGITNGDGSVCVQNSDCGRSTQSGTGSITFSNCVLMAMANCSKGEVVYNGCVVQHARTGSVSSYRQALNVTGDGAVFINGCVISPYNTLTVSDRGKLFIENSRINRGISCTSKNGTVILKNNDFPISASYGAITLGTDNDTIPQFNITGNKFAQNSISIGGNGVTHVTSANGQYMPEFSNTFAEVAT